MRKGALATKRRPPTKPRADLLPERIANVLRQRLSRESIVDVYPSNVRDNLHVLVISRDLDKMSDLIKQEHVWSLLEGELEEHELNRISALLAYSVTELKG